MLASSRRGVSAMGPSLPGRETVIIIQRTVLSSANDVIVGGSQAVNPVRSRLVWKAEWVAVTNYNFETAGTGKR